MQKLQNLFSTLMFNISIANLESAPPVQIRKIWGTIHSTPEQLNVYKGHKGRQYTAKNILFCVHRGAGSMLITLPHELI
jgi:hypothetical protein